MTDQFAGDEVRADGGESPPGNAGHDEWLDALADGDGYALVCPDGHGSLPPRRVCPDCGSTALSREPLPETGTVETFSVVHVPSPEFADDAPYVSAIAEFGPVRLTGVLRGVELDPDAISVGRSVNVGVEERVTDKAPLVAFRPVDAADA
jgi:hypothetical protein